MRSRSLLLLCLLLALGCTRWRVSSTSPAETVTHQRGSTIQVLTRYDTTIVTSAVVANDSLFGRSERANSLGSRRYAIALPDVLQIRVRHFDAARSAVALVAVAGAVALVAAAVDEGDPPPPPSNGGGSGGCGSSGCLYSCPMVYSWDGQRYRLDSGTFGGAIVRALQRTDLDNLDYATSDGGLIRLRVANQLNETDHLDAIHVLAVDHAAGVVVAPDAAGRAHGFLAPVAPVRAVDFRGHDAMGRVAALDDRYWISDPTNRDSAQAADVRDGIELSFVRPTGAQTAHLVVDANDTQWATMLVGQWIGARGDGTAAWYDSLNANPRKATVDMAPLVREGFLTAKVWNGTTWTVAGQFWEAGPEVLKRQVLELDLRSVTSDTVRVRLESAPSLWRIDQVAMSFGGDEPIHARELSLQSARRDTGEDVRLALTAPDDQTLTLETGEMADLVFTAEPTPQGLARTYLLRSTGWYHINEVHTGPADVVMLDRLVREPLALSKIAVGRLNEALATLREAAAR